MAAGQDIADNAGNALPGTEPATDETYSLDNTTPSISAFSRLSPADNPTNADTLVFLATFSEDVQNVGTTDFTVSGGSTATVTTINQTSASVYSLTVSGGDLASFNGVVGLDLAGAQDIADNAGNALPGTEPTTDETYSLDNTTPSISSFTRLSPASNPTNADTLIFRATFSEDVQNVGTTDFTVSGGTTATVTNVSTVSASVYDITVSGGDLASFNGVVGLDLAGAQDIADNAGNALPGTEPATDETYTLDNTTPSISSFTRLSPASNPTNADTLVFLATFSEDVQNVGTADFTVSGGTTATVTNVNQTSASTYSLTVSSGDLASFNGTVGLDLAGGQDIADDVGNALPGTEPATDETYTLDNTAPTVIVDSLTTFDTTPELTGTIDDNSAAIALIVNGNNYAATNNGDGTWTLADNTISPALAGRTYEVAVTATDAVGNIGNDSTSNELVVAIASVTITQTSGSTDVEEGGTADTYLVVLDAQPTGDVIINITPDGQTSVDLASLTFNTSNWDTPQTVTVTANDDSTIEGNHSSTITHAIAPGSAPEYLGISISNVAVNIEDNDFNDITSGPGGQTLTGTAGPDRFIYNNLSEGGDTIANFTNSDDKIDISGVLSQIGYGGSDPIADSYLSFQVFGSHTIINLDVDGSATRGVPRGFLLVENISPGDLNNLDNFII